MSNVSLSQPFSFDKQKDSQTVQNEYSVRWVIESMHREIKQLTGIEKCQCRKQRIQRNHIACSFLVWAFLKRTARKTKETIYKVKNSLLDNYMKSQNSEPPPPRNVSNTKCVSCKTIE